MVKYHVAHGTSSAVVGRPRAGRPRTARARGRISDARRALRGRCARRTRCRTPDTRAAAPRCRSRRRARARGCSGRAGTSRSCDTNSIVPSKSFSASTSISLVARSRWLVGSSSTRKFGGLSSIRAMHQPRLLAARQRADLLVDVVARELERAGQVAQRADRLVREVLLQLLLDRQVGIEQVERLLREVAHLAGSRRAAPRRRPARSAPAIIFSSVDLPAPFLPITHQRSPRRIVRFSPSWTTRRP